MQITEYYLLSAVNHVIRIYVLYLTRSGLLVNQVFTCVNQQIVLIRLQDALCV